MKQEEIFKEAEEYVNGWIKSKPDLEPAKDYLIRAFVDGSNWAFNPLSKFMGHPEKEIKDIETYTIWLARDSNGDLWFYRDKPRKSNTVWLGTWAPYNSPKDPFPDIKWVRWEDEEPTEVEVLIKKKEL